MEICKNTTKHGRQRQTARTPRNSTTKTDENNEHHEAQEATSRSRPRRMYAQETHNKPFENTTHAVDEAVQMHRNTANQQPTRMTKSKNADKSETGDNGQTRDEHKKLQQVIFSILHPTRCPGYLKGYALCRQPLLASRGCHLGALVRPF